MCEEKLYAQLLLETVFGPVNIYRETRTESHVGRRVIRCPLLLSLFNSNLNLSTDCNRVRTRRLEISTCFVSSTDN
jgi:hypothetical protein